MDLLSPGVVSFRGVHLMSETAVRFADVWKRFRLGETHDSLRDLLASGLSRLLGARTERGTPSTFWALREVGFSITHGEAVGIIGPNGAGKSTALKLMAGILRADRGEVTVGGRLAALIEVGAGFHGDLTGRENIFLNGAIMGMRREEIRRKLDTIVGFAGLERFLDMPVKRYSSGMYARLGFSIAAHLDPDILLVDEVLSVGDAVFRLRCEDRMRELVHNGTTLVFVTHNLEQVQAICRRAIVLEGGAQSFDGSAREAVGHYMTAMSRAYTHRPSDVPADRHDHGGAVELLGVQFLGDHGEAAVWIRPHEVVRAQVTFRLHRPIPRLTVELAARASASENLLCFNSGREARFFAGCTGVNVVTLTIPTIPLAGGRYFWNVRMWDADAGTCELDTPFRFPMVIEDDGGATGALSLAHEWACEGPAPGELPEDMSRHEDPAKPTLVGAGD
jgi:ABC-type polysaccharide/polyol phosphate transport system ATPase subunit